MKADDLKTKKGKKKKKTHGLSKGELHRAIAEKSGLSKKRVAEVFDALEHVLAEQLNSDGPGEFTLPGLAKFTTATRPAIKARTGINPFTGEAHIPGKHTTQRFEYAIAAQHMRKRETVVNVQYSLQNIVRCVLFKCQSNRACIFVITIQTKEALSQV